MLWVRISELLWQFTLFDSLLGRLFVLLNNNQKHKRQMCLHQHILQIHSNEIRINSQHSSLLKCTFPAYDSWETWEQDHITDHVFEFLKIFCGYILLVIRLGCIQQKISNSDINRLRILLSHVKIKIKKCSPELVRPLWNQPGVRFLPALCSSVPRVWPASHEPKWI